MAQRLLEGDVMESRDVNSELERLRAANDRLTRERDALREENAELQERVAEGTAPLQRLRKTLEPLYHALAGVFGELKSVAPPSDDAPQGAAKPPSDHVAAAWEEWKTKMGNGAAQKIITALQKHGSANADQLMILIGTPRRKTVHEAIYKLNKAGLIDKNGDRFSLKSI